MNIIEGLRVDRHNFFAINFREPELIIVHPLTWDEIKRVAATDPISMYGVKLGGREEPGRVLSLSVYVSINVSEGQIIMK